MTSQKYAFPCSEQWACLPAICTCVQWGRIRNPERDSFSSRPDSLMYIRTRYVHTELRGDIEHPLRSRWTHERQKGEREYGRRFRRLRNSPGSSNYELTAIGMHACMHAHLNIIICLYAARNGMQSVSFFSSSPPLLKFSSSLFWSSFFRAELS